VEAGVKTFVRASYLNGHGKAVEVRPVAARLVMSRPGMAWRGGLGCQNQAAIAD
jgi:hypothetical protein